MKAIYNTSIKFVIIVLLFLRAPIASHAQSFSVNQIKGAFLYKITKFIRWDVQDKIKLCFTDDKEDQAGKTVAETVNSMANKNSNGKFEILENVNMKYIRNCNLLFIGSKSEPNLQDILVILDGKAIVTISDIDSFTRRGGMFGFIKQNDNVTVELNFTNAKKQNVNINSALQEMVNIVK